MSKSIELKFGVLGGGSISSGSGKIIADQINSIVNQIESGGITNLKFRVDPASLKVIQTQLGSIGSAASTKDLTAGLNKLEAKYSSLGKSFASSDVTRALSQMKNSVIEINRLRSLSNPTKEELSNLKSLEAQWLQNKQAVEQYIASVNQQKATIAKIAGTGANSVESHYNEAQQFYQYGSLGSNAAGATALNAKMQELNTTFSAYNALKAQADVGFIGPDDIALLETYGNKIRALSNEIRNLSMSASGDSRAGLTFGEMESFSSIQRQAKAVANLKRLYGDQINKNAELSSSFSQLEKSFTLNSAGNAYIGFQNTAKGAKMASAAVNNFRTKLDEAGIVSQSFIYKTKELFTKHFSTYIAMAGVTLAMQAFQQLYENVSNVDKAMTELKKVTNETKETYNAFLDSAITKSQQLGASVADYVNATADFARLGYTIDESDALATAATVYKNVGDGIESIDMASESIIATMKAFGIEATKAMDIIDAFNEVGNNFAISSTGIGEAITRSASSLFTAGNTLAESIALITAANSSVQDPEKVGTTLKTVTMFLRAAKDEADAAGESTDGMANSVSELRTSLLGLTNQKVDIMVDGSTFKSTTQILRELAQVWDELTDVDKANILEKIGGKRNSNVVSSLITNFETVEEVLATTQNDSGSAMKEQEKWLDSIEGKTSQFKSSFEALSTTVLDSELVKGIVASGTTILNVLNSLLGVMDGFPVKMALIITTVNLLGKGLLKIVPGIISAFSSAGSSISSLLAYPLTLVAEGFVYSAQTGAKFGQTVKHVFKTFGTDVAGAGSSLISAIGPTMWIAIAAAAIYAIAKIWEEVTDSLEDIQSRIDEAQSEISNNESEINNCESQIADNLERINELKDIGTDLSRSEISALEEENLELNNKKALLEKINQLKREELNTEGKKFAEAAKSSSMSGGSYYYSNGKEMDESYARWQILIDGDYRPLSMTSAASSTMSYLDQQEDVLNSINKQIAATEDKEELERLKERLASTEELITTYKTRLLEMYDKIENSGTTDEELLQLQSDIIASVMGYDDALQKIKNGLNSKEGLSKNDAEGSLKAILGEGYDGFLAKYNGDVIAAARAINEMDAAQIAAAQSATELEENIGSATAAINSLEKMSDAGDAMNEIVGSLNDGEGVGFDNIKDLTKALKELGIESEAYIDQLLDADGDISKTKDVLSDITNAIIDQKIAKGELTAENEKELAIWLESHGVLNAEEVARKKLAVATAENVNATTDEIIALMGEAGASDTTKVALFNLAMAKLQINSNGIDTADDIKQVIALANAAGVGAEKLTALNSALSVLESTDPRVPGWAREEAQATLDALNNGTYDFGLIDPYEFIYSGDGTGGSSGKDPVLEKWEKSVKEQKHLLEMDKQTKEQYHNWLRSNYKKMLADTEKYSEERQEIEEELYNWEKERIRASVDEDVARLDYDRTNGLISEEEYFQKLEKIYNDGYDELKIAIEEFGLYGVDTQERLEAETQFLEDIKNAHNSAYEAEKKQLEHNLNMKLITEEQYLIELTRLYNKYYDGRAEYSEEAMEVQEELFKEQTEIIEKWAQAAADAVESIAKAAEDAVSAVTDLIEGSIDAHEENFNLEKGLLDHALAMNYISEEEYYNSLESLYKKYFKDKYIYMEQYWENQEEVYQHEQEMLEESASAVEDIHAKVVDMIKQELEDAIESIEEAKEKYLDLIDIRREALNEQKDEEDYNKERDEQIANISELQRQLNALANDTSAEGIRKYKEVYNQLMEAEDALAEFEREHTYEQMNDELDNEAEAVENRLDGKITEYEKLLDDNVYLVEEAWRRMSDMNTDLYNQLAEHNAKHTTSIKDDLTDAWNTATEAVNRYNDAQNGYKTILEQIGQPGMDSGEYDSYAGSIKTKQTFNWVEIAGTFGAEMLGVGTSLLTDFTGILDAIFDSPATKLLDMGAGALSAFTQSGASILTTILGLLGGFAGGTSYVPKTGMYLTDELGEELKLIKNPNGASYTMLTRGSKVITNEATERLMKLVSNPDLLTGGVAKIKVADVGGSIPTQTINNQPTSIQNTFYIQSNTPKEVASEIEKLMPKIASYTIGSMVNGSNNLGIKRKTQHLY